MDEAILYREQDSIIYIRALGHITANVCADLKARVFDRLEAKPPINDILIDLSECDYMDSTFMGLLVGFNKRFLRYSEKPVSILQANDTCKKLLRTIGVLRLVSVIDEKRPFPEPLENLNSGRKAGSSLILKAHEELIEISEENEARFSTLRDVLKSSLESGESQDETD